MKKWWIVAIVVIAGGIGLYLTKVNRNNEEKMSVEDIIHSNHYVMENTENNEKNDLFKTIEDELLSYYIDGLCGYVNEEANQGVLTLNKKIPTNLYNKYFPTLQKDSSIAINTQKEFIYIMPNDYFPLGELGEVNVFIQNDSLIQMQFTVTSLDNVVEVMVDELNVLAMSRDSLKALHDKWLNE